MPVIILLLPVKYKGLIRPGPSRCPLRREKGPEKTGDRPDIAYMDS